MPVPFGRVESKDSPENEWVIRFSSAPLVVMAVTVAVGVLGQSWFVGVLWGPLVLLLAVVSWRPFRLSTGARGPQLEYLKGLRWHHLPMSDVVALRYEHTPRDLRGRALLRADLTDGRTIRVPGTAGIYWLWTSPTILTSPIPPRRLHLVSTVQMLSLLQQRLGRHVDTYGAVSMNPRR